MLSVGIIGCGGVVERRHLPGLLELPDVARITAMADIDEARLNALAGLSGVAPSHRYGNAHDLLAAETLDLLIVATPLVYHEEAVLDAAGRVATVLVEKPLSHDVASGERMVEACERAGTRLGVVHNELLRPSVEAAAELLASGQIGKPFLYRNELLGSSHRPGRGTDPDWRTQRAYGAGGCLIDNAYHAIYLAERLIGSPVATVQAQIDTFTHEYDVEDTAFVLLRHAGGGLTSLQSSWGIVSGRYTATRVHEVHATGGSILFEREGAAFSVAKPGQEKPEPSPVAPERSDDAGHWVFRDRFLDAVISGQPLPTTGLDALHVLAVIEAAYASARDGCAVTVSS